MQTCQSSRMDSNSQCPLTLSKLIHQLRLLLWLKIALPIPSLHCPWNRSVGRRSQMYSSSPALYLPQEQQHSPFLVIMNGSVLPPLLSPSLHSSLLLVSTRDAINHVDTLLVLIRRVPSYPPSLFFFCTLYLSLSIPLNLSLTHAHWVWRSH